MSHSSRSVAFQSYVLVTDTELVVRWVNEGFCDRLSCRPSDIIGLPLAHFLAEPGKHHEMALRQRMLDGEAFDTRVTLETSRGRRRQFDFRVIPVAEGNGTGRLYLAIGGKSSMLTKSVVSLPAPTGFEGHYRGSSLTFDQGKAYYEKLQALMKDERVFVQPDLTLARAAKSLGTNTQYLSQVVNFFSGERFSTYVNAYRLKALHDHLRLAAANGADDGINWSQVGFGSYSAFYRALRKQLGQSPAEFAQSALRADDEEGMPGGE